VTPMRKREKKGSSSVDAGRAEREVWFAEPGKERNGEKEKKG